MNQEMRKDRAAVPVPPPLLFFGCLAAGFLLEFLSPSRPVGWPGYQAIAGGLVAVSGFLALGAFRALRKSWTPFDPWRPTVMIIREGPFRYSRNPLYLALLLLLIAAALLAGSLWLILAVPVLLFLLDAFAIRPEEEYLERKFGDVYRDYKASVRRWI